MPYMNVHSKLAEALPPKQKLSPDCHTVRQKARIIYSVPLLPVFRTVILLLQRDDTTNQSHKGKHILCTLGLTTTRQLFGFWQRFQAGCNSTHHTATPRCGNNFILGMKCKFGWVYTHFLSSLKLKHISSPTLCILTPSFHKR